MGHAVRSLKLVFMLMLAAGVASVAGGCAMTRAPELHAQRVSWDEASDVARLLAFEVLIENTNTPREETSASGRSRAVRLIEVHYEVELDGQKVYRGRWDARATLAAGTQRVMTLPAVVAMDDEEPLDLGYRLSAFSFQPSADGRPPKATYRIRGHMRYLTADRLSEILADLGLRHQRARFSAEGEIVE